MPESPLRIGLLTHSVNPRGGVVHTLELAGALHAAGHAVTIMAPTVAQQRLFRGTSCRVDLFGLPSVTGSVTETIRMRIEGFIEHLTAVRASQPVRASRPVCAARPVYAEFDVMHAQDGIGANALTTLSERGLIPGFVRTVHHVERHSDALINGWEERGIRGARQLCCVSSHWQDTLRRDYGLPSRVVNNGVNLGHYTPRVEPGDAAVAQRLGLTPGAPLIVSIGGVEERKNTVRILQAFIALRRQMPRAQWVIAGGASLLDHSHYRGQFDSLVEANGLTVGPGAAIVRTGVLPDADIPALLRLANAVAFPSLREGFGLVVLEALASGTPTVVSAIAPFTEYLRGDDVHWANPLDPASIAAALAAAVARPKFLPPAVCARFSWDASAAQHIAVYREFLSTDSSAIRSTRFQRH